MLKNGINISFCTRRRRRRRPTSKTNFQEGGGRVEKVLPFLPREPCCIAERAMKTRALLQTIRFLSHSDKREDGGGGEVDACTVQM